MGAPYPPRREMLWQPGVLRESLCRLNPFWNVVVWGIKLSGSAGGHGGREEEKRKGTVVLGNTPSCLAVKELQRVRPSLCLACPSVYLCQGRDIWLEHFPEGIDLFFWARKNMNELFEACSKDTNNIPGNTSKSHNIHIIWSIRGK